MITDMKNIDVTIMMDDIMKALTLAVVVHILSYSLDDKDNIFDEKSLKKFLYIIISMILYNLFIRKIFIHKNNKKKKNKKNNKK